MSNAGYTKQNVRLGPVNAFAIGSSDVSICTPNSAGKVFTAKHITATNSDSATHYLCISVGPNNVVANRIIDGLAVPPNGDISRFVNTLVGNSDTGGLCIAADTTGKIAVTID